MDSPALDAIRSITVGTEFEENLYLVGGAVRDPMLGLDHSGDFDLVTTGSSLELALLLTPISSISPVTYPRFGTAMVRIQGSDIELVTARAESYAEESRKPIIEPASLKDDAYRRDFTVNSLMQSLRSGEILDLTDQGLRDLETKTLRTPLDPGITFYDDPLRMLRAVRFRWKLGFEPAPGLYEAIWQSRERLKIVSMERVRDELIKILGHRSAQDALDDLMQLGLLDLIAPEFRPMVDCEQGKYHHLDVWDHTLLVVKNAGSKDLTLTLAALLHDVGKPRTRTIDVNGNTRFFGHESLGREMASELLKRLKFPQKEIDLVALLVGNHMRLGSSRNFSLTASRRLIRDMGGETERLLLLVEADMNGLKPGVAVMDLAKIRERLQEVNRVSPVNQLVSPLNGEEIIALTHFEAGPKIGQVKTWLVEQVLEGTLKPGDKETAARWVIERFKEI